MKETTLRWYMPEEQMPEQFEDIIIIYTDKYHEKPTTVRGYYNGRGEWHNDPDISEHKSMDIEANNVLFWAKIEYPIEIDE